MTTSRSAFTPYQKFVIGTLAFMQFTVILDFVIMSPLGAIIMPALKINPSQFGAVVSAYAFSAGASGLLSAGFADRFDRKKILLFFYVGFLVGTFLCAIAPTFYFLLAARMFTGVFGGVLGSVVLAITTDVFSFEQRGRVMGVIQTAFAASQILGIPVGLAIANAWGWHSAFFMIVALGALVGAVIFSKLKPIDGHLKEASTNPQAKSSNPLFHLFATVTSTRYLIAFATTALLGMGGYMLMPFGSAFSVHNLGLELSQLPTVYFITGLGTIVIGPLVGRAADQFGKYRVFLFGAVLSIIMVLIYTHLERTPLWAVVLVNVFLFAGIFSRMIPSQALMSAVPAPNMRGSFMAVNASVQQVSGGIGTFLAGLLITEGADGRIEHFDQVGYVVVGTSVFTAIMMYFINKMVGDAKK